MRKIQYKHSISGVFVFLLLGIFAIASTVLVVTGAHAYNASAQRSALHNEERLSSAYVRGRLREADEQGMLNLSALDGADMLKLMNNREGTAVVLYVYEGMLYEWYTTKSLAERFEGPDPAGAASDGQQAAKEGAGTAVVQPAMGEAICPLDEMRVNAKGNLITVSLLSAGEWTDVDYAVRSAAQDQR